MKRNYLFPRGFLWGSATSSYQIEGGVIQNEWHSVYKQGKMRDTADPAESANFWKYYEEDIVLMKQMNHRTFRMSVEWARIEPEEGCFDEDAIRHYRKIIVAIKEAGILPIVDLHHHSDPLWLIGQGGWLNRKTVLHLNRFARRVVSALGDLVNVWLTVNEPAVWAGGAYLLGLFPPYEKSLFKMLRCLNNFAQAHVALYETINELFSKNNWGKPVVGFAKDLHRFDPYNEKSRLDRLAVGFVYKIFADYFYDRINRKGRTIDILGMNYYFTELVKFPFRLMFHKDLPKTKEGWGIDPQGFYWTLKHYWEKFRMPIWVTENGVGEDDDELRPRFILDHVYQMHRAISEGVDVRAYYHWSTMDTLEFDKGFSIKYGLIKVDFESEEKTRTLRKSGKMYGEIAKANGITEEIVKRYVPDWQADSDGLDSKGL